MNNYQKLLEQREKLPVYQYKKQFLDDLESNQCVLLIGETGSGKTTQVPQWCCDYLMEKNPEKPLKVVCTQPRQVAAINVAQRVADEMNVKLGTTVGYSIRFNNHTSPSTKLKFVTDGLLLRSLMENPLLEGYGVVILDEAHERSLSTDILLGFVKRAINLRDNLKLIIMSATIDANLFINYFQECSLAVLNIPGRAFPVEIVYEDHEVLNYLEYVKEKVIKIHTSEPKGNILVFLTGEQEIETMCEDIRQSVKKLGRSVGTLSVLPLYSVLSGIDQQKIFEPAPRTRGKLIGRKCIISTNIAETSITIDDVVYVIDSGHCKQKIFSPEKRIEVVKISPISKASANQRTGRAGRTARGKCYRIYSEEFYKRMNEYRKPEIMMCNLASLVLLLKRLGVDNLVTFDYLSPPYPSSMIRALDLLYDLGAIDGNGNLTDEGRMLYEFPIDPPLAKMLVTSAKKYGCSQEIVSLVSMLSVPPAFYRPFAIKEKADEAHAKFIHPDGDHLTLINIFDGFLENDESFYWCRNNFLRFQSLAQALNIKYQLEGIMEKLGLQCVSMAKDSPEYSINVRKCILEGCFTQVVAKYGKKGTYVCVKDGTKNIKIHPLSGHGKIMPEWIVYHEFVRTYRKFVRTVSAVDPQWLLEIASHYYDPQILDSEYLSTLFAKKPKKKEQEQIEATADEEDNESNCLNKSAEDSSDNNATKSEKRIKKNDKLTLNKSVKLAKHQKQALHNIVASFKAASSFMF